MTIEVGLELLAGAQPDARLGERLDLVGDDRRAPVLQRLEQIAVRHQAEALVPRVVARREVRARRRSPGRASLRTPSRISFFASSGLLPAEAGRRPCRAARSSSA